MLITRPLRVFVQAARNGLFQNLTGPGESPRVGRFAEGHLTADQAPAI
jgi:hypothetical protein